MYELRYKSLMLYQDVAKDNDFKAMRELCLNDLFYLILVACRRSDIDRDWLFDRCREVEADPNDRIDLWSREAYKSTIITFGKTIQDILRNPEETIGIFSHTRPIAKAFLNQIKREFEINTFLQDLFPEILYKSPHKEAVKWSIDDGIIVKRKGNPKESTIEAWGLIDGMPTSKHYSILVYDDVVTREAVSTPEMIAKVTECFGLSLNLGKKGGIKRYIGTRYHACLVSKTRILMSDWSHKSISDIRVGDEVVGWELIDSKGSNQFRILKKSKVIAVGMYPSEVVKEYKFNCGRSVVATPSHKWWRGANGSGKEYKELGLHYHKMKSVRRLLDPCVIDESKEAGWLSGFFDGEGSVRKNTNHPSGGINITQSNKYPLIVKRLRDVLDFLGFEWVEDWNKRINLKWFDVCMFKILGGWRECYRFLTQINPSKYERISEILYSQLKTTKTNLVEIIDKPNEDVYWFECETGNYIAEGFCSKNSDTYATIIKRKTARPRIYPATDDGTFSGNPVLFTKAEFDKKVEDMGSYLASCQLLQNPLADNAMGFRDDWLSFYKTFNKETRSNFYILADPASEKKKINDYTVFVVIALNSDGNYYLVDGVRDRMNLTERTEKLFELVRNWKPLNVGYEKYGMQSDIEHIKYVMEQENYRFRITELGGRMPKQDRIRRLVPKFENHKFYLPNRLLFRTVTGKQEDFVKLFLEQEYTNFPVCSHDDMLDCISRIVDEDLNAVFPKHNKQAQPIRVMGSRRMY